MQESVNVVFDDYTDISGRIEEDHVEDYVESTKNTTRSEPTDHVDQNVASTPTPTSDSPSASEEDEDTTDLQSKQRRDPPGRIRKNHPTTQVIGDVNDGVQTRRRDPVNYKEMVRLVCMTSRFLEVKEMCFISEIEPKNAKEALKDHFWVNAMHEELNQFERNNVWTLVPRPPNKNVIGTKWIFKNKTDEYGNISRNKARLVAQGYTQVEGIDFDETFAPVARIESIRLLLAIACYLKINLQQMDVKGAFLNGILKEEAYVEQPKGFEDAQYPNHVYKLNKALYGLKQAPRAWYGRLTDFLIQEGFIRGQADRTLFIKVAGKRILIAQIYVDDIVFGATDQTMLDSFVEAMYSTFEMSMVGELNYFLGLQIKQGKDGLFICQSKYAKNLVKRFGLETAKHMRTPMGSTQKMFKDDVGEDVDPTLYRSMIGSLLYLTASRPDIMYSVCVCARYQAQPKASHLKAVKRIIRYVAGSTDLGIWFSKDTNMNLVGYSDADWAGDVDDRKSTSGACSFLGNNLVSWHSRKQNCISLSTAEAEYIAAGSCCTQLLWLKQMLDDYGFETGCLTLLCDNSSAINISKNPVQHSRTKHIEIRHHFLRELVEKEIVKLEYVSTSDQISDIFTKPLDFERFSTLRKSLGLCVI